MDDVFLVPLATSRARFGKPGDNPNRTGAEAMLPICLDVTAWWRNLVSNLTKIRRWHQIRCVIGVE